MPYPKTEDYFKAGMKVLFGATLVIMLLFGVLWHLSDTNEPAYDYAGPDGTLTGVPTNLLNYVVEDHDTGCYYFIIVNRDTGDVAICPRFEADGTLWTNPLHEEESE